LKKCQAAQPSPAEPRRGGKERLSNYEGEVGTSEGMRGGKTKRLADGRKVLKTLKIRVE